MLGPVLPSVKAGSVNPGLAGMEKLPEWMGKNPKAFNPSLLHQAKVLREYVPLRGKIEQFWLDKKNRETPTWETTGILTG